MKKYNIGSPKRIGKTKSKTTNTTSYKKKYNIGRPVKVVVTPDTPRSKKWKKMREENAYKNYEISEYEPDEDENEEVFENAMEPGTYTAFEETITPYMEYALQKKPFTRLPTDAQVDKYEKAEKAWKQKLDDSPNKLYPEPKRLIPYPESPSKRPRTSSKKGRSRGRGRGRTRRTRG
jgi:hypothetical protein